MKLDLNTVYKELDFESGDLFYVASWREGNGGDITIDRLATNPRILDPACGSGIFLVDAFRRIVRYKKLLKG